ncbi:MAG: glycosyltransferase [Paracoccaceae bacterium]|nr:glycosyltransferase [Paracoccaceae bacterium]
MPAPVSVIIPTLNVADRIGPCLHALFAGLDAGLIHELILSDGGSSDDIEKMADELGARFVSGPQGRGGQLRRGAEVARAPWLLFLHADTVLAPGWEGVVAGHVQGGRCPTRRPGMDAADDTVADMGRAAVFRLGFDSAGMPGRLVAGWANLRTRLFGLPYGDQGLLVSRALYDAVGGFPDIPLMEDVAMACALRGRIDLLPAHAITDAGRYQREGWLRRGGRNLWTLARYFAGVPPERLVRGYEGGQPSN